MCRHRDWMVTVTSSGCVDGAHSKNTVRAGGSSTTFSSASDAASVSRSASSITTTCQRPSAGRRAAVATTARISATEMDSPSGTTDRTSGWLRLSTVWHAEHSPQPRLSGRSHCRAAASARAATDRPDPGGPVNSQACVIAPVGTSSPEAIARAAAAAFRRTATASSWPTRASQTVTLDPRSCLCAAWDSTALSQTHELG